ncbi:hypothetical protein [Roseovarius sp. E0-M6]|uniref:hypothetical protein n=1 Tax=Roseovarius sp. E0-M6 TaxID=3127118 RepID=UPI0030100DF9
MRLALILLCLLAACGRPLTPAEKSFAKQIHGDTITTRNVRFVVGAPVDAVTYTRDKRPRLACRERILPEPETDTITVAPAAVALYNRIFYAKPYYLKDYLRGYPNQMGLIEAMFFAHEMTHVWQWQNRAITGYTPYRASREHRGGADPYLFDINTKTRFLDYSYEQQASIVEEYVCCATLDAKAPRTDRLRSLIRGAMPLKTLHIPDEVYLPWDGVETEGICR